MKYTIFFFVALLAIASYQVIAEMDEESFNAMFKNLSKECKKKENATDEDIDVIISKETPTTKPGQCIFVCLMTQYGMVILIIYLCHFKLHKILTFRW